MSSLMQTLTASVPNCVGCSPAHGSGFVLSFIDGTSRLATEAEVLVASKAACMEQIKAGRDRRRVAGCPVGEHVFHSDDSSRIQQIGLVMLGNNIPAGLKWKVIGGAMVTMTPTLAQQVFAAQAARDTALFATAESHIAAINALTTVEAVEAYDASTGWPA